MGLHNRKIDKDKNPLKDAISRRGRQAIATAALLVLLFTIVTPSSEHAGERRAAVPDGILLAILGLEDALADGGDDDDDDNDDDGGGGDDGGGDTGGDDGGGGDTGGGDDSGDTGGDTGGATGVLASFILCDSVVIGEPGRRIDVLTDGRTLITKIRCD